MGEGEGRGEIGEGQVTAGGGGLWQRLFYPEGGSSAEMSVLELTHTADDA